MATATAPKEVVVQLPELRVKTLKLRLHGTAPLISHKWADKAKQQMLDKQMKKASSGKVAKDPEQDYHDSMYKDADGDYAFPAIAFKAAAVRAGTYADQKMSYLRGAFQIAGEFVKIEGVPNMREDMVRVGMGTADIRYRGEFNDWACELTLRYNENAISLDQLVNLFRIAGFSVGIGEWRPERDGQYGTFEIEKQEEQQ